MSQVRAKKVAVVGLGKTGLSCARWLHAQGAEVAVLDSRTTPPGLAQLQDELPDVAVLVGGFDASVLAAVDEIIVSPGVPANTTALRAASDKGIPIVGDIELFARAATAPVIAITGSNGKSTVTTLVGEMLRHAGLDAAVGGNLGIPALDLLRADAQWYVLELSSFQLETTKCLPVHAATVINLSADHLDRYPDMAAYGAAKARIFAHAERALVNRDDPTASALAAGVADQVGFSLSEPANEVDYGLIAKDQEVWLARGRTPLIATTELRMPGQHNLANALAALALAEMAGVSPEAGCEVLREFPGLAHRSELVAERRGVRWINDSKGTNPGATIAALAGIVDEPGQGASAATAQAVLIAGGEGKGADFSSLAPVVRRCARAVVLIGRDAALLEQALNDTAPLHRAASMEEAVRLAEHLAQPGDTVLLSPACASFDMFDDYQHRGRAFAAAVAGLAP
ncbi:UDP-N-acetylmuramoyl-L-alanine--D-glutamate ligase [Lamprobacter modestohalophilus]|uniref:UDP-N-acetylmuramoyl-L-alanine--D-glutamate ligase n=1 Tax=Lamprobacter modestohalophilus TaxID=1064514 RepID=UPI002ADEDBEA|nr:UDP-N-acetylmuramoyl-L-alanine--D-glutamate ligase [Lamprobacter modestohalophilus]MEA1048713.1 UDP-N-acetylmuramoyl-L-alanine--D-glutamate ligase [Lamprobacter modestohalophilus]